jgi:Carbohydrate-binding module 48 (Isoamylase N-terminal domain)
MMCIRVYRETLCRNWGYRFAILFLAIALRSLAQTPLPLGSTPQGAGATFRLWAPFVDSVAIKVNDAGPVAMTKETGHTQADDAVWILTVPGAKAGDRYKYLIKSNGVTGEFIDPRAQQLTGPGPGASSVIVDLSPVPSPMSEPEFNCTSAASMSVPGKPQEPLRVQLRGSIF